MESSVFLTSVSILLIAILLIAMRLILQYKKRISVLKEDKQLAEEANRAKSQFVANITHEIRTPLSGLSRLIELMALEGFTEKQKELSELAESSLDSLNVLTNDLLDMSKVVAGKLEIEHILVRPVELLSPVLAIYQTLMDKKGLAFNVDFSELHHEVVVSDPHRIKQVVNNLLSNALKFTETGSVTVVVASCLKPNAKSSDKEVMLKISVQDTGIGMCIEQREGLFEAYSQAESSTARLYGGTGLGLSISRELAQLMRGDIFVTSEKKVGSTFIVKLTVGTAGSTKLLQAAVDSGNGANAQTHTRESIANIEQLGLTHVVGNIIIVADDNEVNRVVVMEVLNKLDEKIEVIEAKNGREVLSILESLNENEKPIILMDCQMPELDGYQASKAIRNGDCGEHFKGITIIATSAGLMEMEEKLLDESGMNDFIAQPIGPNDLRRVLAKWVQEAC